MGRIIHCADLIIRVDDQAEIGNLTQWILESTDFRPTAMETCSIRSEMSTYEKLWLILVVWITIVILSFLYCYFCEQRLFSTKSLFDRDQASSSSLHLYFVVLTVLPQQDVDSKGLLANGRCPNQECNAQQYNRSLLTVLYLLAQAGSGSRTLFCHVYAPCTCAAAIDCRGGSVGRNRGGRGH